MSKQNFHDQQKDHQIQWRKNPEYISTAKQGKQNGKYYQHIIPWEKWEETLFPPIKKELIPYLSDKKIQKHTGTHNLLSSWIVCANLYFIIHFDKNFKTLFLNFLQQNVSADITDIIETELEFAFEEDNPLSPTNLLGEKDGSRGSGQTSPDVAFIVKTNNGDGLILTECKYTEHSFYPCSARRTKKVSSLAVNPDPSRCMNAAANYNHSANCHQTEWERLYWNNLQLSPTGKAVLKRCPAATAGYQLFRQQSLSEGIAKSKQYDLVVSSVAFDGRNTDLIGSLKSTGIPDFTADWADLFTGKAAFKTWTHQQWVEYVRNNGTTQLQKDWVTYLHERYGY